VTSDPHQLYHPTLFYPARSTEQKGLVVVNVFFFISMNASPICGEVIRWSPIFQGTRHPKFHALKPRFFYPRLTWRHQDTSLSSAIFRFNCTWGKRRSSPKSAMIWANPWDVQRDWNNKALSPEFLKTPLSSQHLSNARTPFVISDSGSTLLQFATCSLALYNTKMAMIPQHLRSSSKIAAS